MSNSGSSSGSTKANSGKIQPGEVRNPYGRNGKPKANAAETESSLIPRKHLANLAGQHFGGDRDLYEVMGYPRHLSPEDYVDIYLRQDIAARIVDAFPDATWAEAPELVGDEAFRKAWDALDAKLKLWRTFHRLDRLAGLGHFGALFLGLDGGERPDQPANGTDYNLLYVQPHSERTAQILQWDDDPTSPRYGKPNLYRITTGVNWTGTGAGQKVITVHHSRVIHVAERAMEDESIGTPRLERIYNRLMDLDKLAGGAPEMYWQNVAMMMALESEAGTEIEPQANADMKAQLEEMQHRLRRFLTLQGVEAKNIAPGLQGSDPESTFRMLVDLVAGSEGIPKRILMGNEAGELASSQDETAWAERIAERREQHVTPGIIEPFIDKGQKLGFLPRGFERADWPEADTLGEKGRAEIAEKKANSLKAYMGTPGAEQIIAPDEFRAWLGEDAERQQADESDLDEDDEEVQAQWRKG